MSCINLAVPIPQIPPILLGLNLTANIQFPPQPFHLGISCCYFSIPGFQIPISIPVPLPPIYFTAINAAIFAALQLLTLNVPDCPGNGTAL